MATTNVLGRDFPLTVYKLQYRETDNAKGAVAHTSGVDVRCRRPRHRRPVRRPCSKGSAISAAIRTIRRTRPPLLPPPRPRRPRDNRRRPPGSPLAVLRPRRLPLEKTREKKKKRKKLLRCVNSLLIVTARVHAVRHPYVKEELARR